MALIVLLRGVNVGGHRTFRPSQFAKDLRAFDVVSVGAAGTFVVRKPGSLAKFRAALQAMLPFETSVMICEGRDVLALETRHPFGSKAPERDTVRFLSVLSKAGSVKPSIPFALPAGGDWLVRVIGASDRFVFGEYRRHMKTIGYLGQLDRLFGEQATTRNWNTVAAIMALLKGDAGQAKPVRKADRAGRKPK